MTRDRTVAATPADLPEREATGEIAAIFADIRAVQRSNNVNYVWRHLATIPGALDAAWALARSRDAQIHAFGERVWSQAETLAHDCRSPSLAATLPEGARAVLASYARGNRWNLAAVTLLLTGSLSESGSVPSDAAAQPPIAALPAYDSLSADAQRAVATLADAGPAAVSGIRPSLWVHLAHWPDCLAALERDLPAVLRSPGFHGAHAGLLRFLGGETGSGGGLPEAAIVSLNRFRQRIAEMALVGIVLSD